MEKEQITYITKNKMKLIKCTRELDTLAIGLESATPSLMSRNSWDEIRKRNDTNIGIIDGIYRECMKRNCYNDLIEILDECENEEAANILRKIPGYNAASAKIVDDFMISENGSTKVADTLKSYAGILESNWPKVQDNLNLSPSEKKKIASSFAISIMNTVDAWRNTAKQNATFNALHAAIRDIDISPADALERNRDLIKNA